MKMNKKGFTLLEVLMVMAAAAVISAISIPAIMRPQTKADLDGEMVKLLSNVRNQQLSSMIGITTGTATPVPYGIYFYTNGYTLFRGASYNPADPGNFSIDFPSTIQMQSTTLATSTIIFNRMDGEVYAYTAGADSVTFVNTVSAATSTITVNRFGAATKTP